MIAQATGTFVAIHLITHEEKHFTSSPREACMAAYAGELGDFNTWEYQARYGKALHETRFGWNLGHWWVKDPAKAPKGNKSEIIKRDIADSAFLNRADLDAIAPNREAVKLTIYDVNEEGYIVNQRGRPVREIVGDLNCCLKKMKWDDDDWGGDYEGFSTCFKSHSRSDKDDPFMWPAEWQWISVYAVTGTSEGDYVHLDVIRRDGSREMMALYKTFGGRQKAQLVACRAATLLGA